jgi:hypothetical protein
MATPTVVRSKRADTWRFEVIRDDGRFHAQGMTDQLLLQVYCSVLNGHPEFVTGLTSLARRLRPHLKEHYLADADELSRFVRHNLQAFVGKWRLPRSEQVFFGLIDCISASYGPDPVELFFFSWVGYNAPEDRYILPNIPLEFKYSPLSMTRSEITKRLQQIQQEIELSVRQQARQIEEEFKSQGFEPLPIRYRANDPDLLPRLALRLFRRAVLEWSFEKIANAEYEETGRLTQRGEVAKTVKDWAKRLQILLPSTGGRTQANK